MEKPKSYDYKISRGFSKDAIEILVIAALALCLGGAGYAFFKYQEKQDCIQITQKSLQCQILSPIS